MKNILQRLWTGIVAAVAGGALSVVVSMLLVNAGRSIDVVLPTVIALAGIGFVVGVVFGGKHPR